MSSFAPDFVIVGAPKCGTTSLFGCLSTHPGITMASSKEPFFWSPDIINRDMVTDPADYAALWASGAPGTLKGEASADYILSELAIPSIVDAKPDAKLILMLRNPADMAASYHAEMVQSFQEPVGDFNAAWRLQSARRNQVKTLPDTIEPRKLQYERVCALGDHLERFIRFTKPENRFIIIFDDWVHAPRSVYLRTLQFLCLADDGRSSFPRLNPNRNLQSVRFAAFHRSVPRYLGRAYAPARRFAMRLGLSPSAVVNRFNIREEPRAPLDPAFEQELLETFKPQVEKIEQLLQIDLPQWSRR